MLNTRLLTLISVISLIFLFSTSCASRTVYVVKTPPAAKVKVFKTPAPYPNAVWVKGHWRWHSGRYVWVDGYWVKQRRGIVWVQGHWVKRPRGWVWMKGHWKRVK